MMGQHVTSSARKLRETHGVREELCKVCKVWKPIGTVPRFQLRTCPECIAGMMREYFADKKREGVDI